MKKILIDRLPTIFFLFLFILIAGNISCEENSEPSKPEVKKEKYYEFTYINEKGDTTISEYHTIGYYTGYGGDLHQINDSTHVPIGKILIVKVKYK